MVDKKITELTELTTPVSADIVAIVDDTTGTPVTKKITYGNLQSNLSVTSSQVSDFDTEVSNNSAVTLNTAKETNVDYDDTTIQGEVDLNTTHRTSDGKNHSDVVTNNAKVGITIPQSSAITANTEKVTNVTTNLSIGNKTATGIDVNSSDGTNATLPEADTTNAGLLGSDKWNEIVANTTKISYNSTASTKLGTIEGSADVTDATNVVSSLSAATLTGALTAADHGTAATDQVVNVCYGTSATPPTASTTTEGSLYVQYTA